MTNNTRMFNEMMNRHSQITSAVVRENQLCTCRNSNYRKDPEADARFDAEVALIDAEFAAMATNMQAEMEQANREFDQFVDDSNRRFNEFGQMVLNEFNRPSNIQQDLAEFAQMAGINDIFASFGF